jgi:hypothetical protein
MTKLQRAEQVLKEAERSLVDMGTAAANERDYDGASALLAVAREVNQLPQRFRHLFGETSDLPRATSNNSSAKRPGNGQSRSGKGGTPKLGSYPKFVRDGENLIKIGWSKAEKSEYEHRSPKRVLSVLTASLDKIAGNGKRFAMESVMPLTDPEQGSEIPPYQLYLCLAWLRQIGVVVQHGRQGYSLQRDENLPSAVESRWKEIPQR